MEDSEIYVNLTFTKTESPSRDGPDPKTSQVNLRRHELHIAKDENPPIAPGPGIMPVTAQAAPHEQEPNKNIGNRPYRLICLLCLFTLVLFVTVVGLLIYVSQIRQSKITTDRNCLELNSTVQSNLSALNSNISDLKQMHSDLHQQFTAMKTKYRSVNETKAQICELLTSRREEDCSEGWVRNGDRCYLFSTSKTSYDEARQRCSSFDSRLLEIIADVEANFVLKVLHGENRSYWIGKCKHEKVFSNVRYRMYGETFECGVCKTCDQDRYHYICEKSAPLRPDISEKIQDLCQQPV